MNIRPIKNENETKHLQSTEYKYTEYIMANFSCWYDEPYTVEIVSLKFSDEIELKNKYKKLQEINYNISQGDFTSFIEFIEHPTKKRSFRPEGGTYLLSHANFYKHAVDGNELYGIEREVIYKSEMYNMLGNNILHQLENPEEYEIIQEAKMINTKLSVNKKITFNVNSSSGYNLLYINNPYDNYRPMTTTQTVKINIL